VAPSKHAISPPEIRKQLEEAIAPFHRIGVLEPGFPMIDTSGGGIAFTERPRSLVMEAWDREHNLTRRISAVEQRKPGKVIVRTERLGGKSGTLTMVDLERAEASVVVLRGEREELREQLRGMLSRQFAGWRVKELTVGADLEHTLSPAYARAWLSLGGKAMAALLSPEDAGSSDAALTFGLIWAAHGKERGEGTVSHLALFVPKKCAATQASRIRRLDAGKLTVQLFAYDEAGNESEWNLEDAGNVYAELSSRTGFHDMEMGTALDWETRLRTFGVEIVRLETGACSYRVKGLQIGRRAGKRVFFGVDKLKAARRYEDLADLAREVSLVRCAESIAPQHPWRLRNPESWLESIVREHLPMLDASLLGEPVYGQVAAVAGVDRGVADLLGVDRNGRLAVIELKVTEDPNLPVQALDYWNRVKWHWERGEFQSKGYFAGMEISPTAPRLLLVAPALQFHPTTETVLGYFDASVPVERIGLGVEWQKTLRVVLRQYGSRRPDAMRVSRSLRHEPDPTSSHRNIQPESE
jgi:hypothetical protein